MLLEQLKSYASSDESYGRIRADFLDLIEACQWFLSVMEQNEERTLSESELEDVLIDIDVKFIQHVAFHLKSLRKDLPDILKQFPNEDSPSAP